MGSTIYSLFFSVIPQDKWRLHNLPARKPDGLNSQERELTQQFPEVWVEDNPAPPHHHPRPPPTPRLAKQVPLVTELKPTMTSAPALGLPDLAQPFTLYLTEKVKVAMGVLSQIMGTWDRPVTYL